MDGRTSERLTDNDVYTRENLKQLFSITDATINTGVFRPKGTNSVWLFVTEQKTADRTPYRDHLEGDLLHWQGQTAGRTDNLIIEHVQRGLELLIFFRKSKYEHKGAGFRYLGPYEYVSHEGSQPTGFVLRRARSERLEPISPMAADEDQFDPSNVEDARERIQRTIAQRRGQRAFRKLLIDAYGGKCAVTGCAVVDVLEAAHIHPYRGPETNAASNGLLLRADLHTLFDCQLIAVDEDSFSVIVAPGLRESEYGRLHGTKLRKPRSAVQAPSREVLRIHQAACGL